MKQFLRKLDQGREMDAGGTYRMVGERIIDVSFTNRLSDVSGQLPRKTRALTNFVVAIECQVKYAKPQARLVSR